MLSALNWEMASNKVPFSVLEKGNRPFQDLHSTLDSIFSESHRKGIEVTRKSAAAISTEDQDRFWKSGALETSSLAVLQKTVFLRRDAVCALWSGGTA